MKLTPHEIDKITLQCAGQVAQRRLARGVRLNVPEATAVLLTRVLEMVRDGTSLSSIMSLGRSLLGRRQVIPGVEFILDEVQVEATFPDGTKLITLHHPICLEDGDLDLCLQGSFLPVPAPSMFLVHPEEGLKPGCIHSPPGSIRINVGRKVIEIRVINRCDRPIQVGSHYNFIETNPLLEFDRLASYGMRLNIAAGTAVRFEPGETKTVSLVNIAGKRIIRGGNGICDGPVVDTADVHASIVAKLEKGGFVNNLKPFPSLIHYPNLSFSNQSQHANQRWFQR